MAKSEAEFWAEFNKVAPPCPACADELHNQKMDEAQISIIEDFYTGYSLADPVECELCGHIGKAARIPLFGWAGIECGCLKPAEDAVREAKRFAHIMTGKHAP